MRHCSAVAKATRVRLCDPIPALKRRAKIMPTLRVGENESTRCSATRSCMKITNNPGVLLNEIATGNRRGV